MKDRTVQKRALGASQLTSAVRRHWKVALLVAAAMAGQTLLTLAQPWPLRALIDHVVQNPSNTNDLMSRYSLTEFILVSIRGFFHEDLYHFLFQGIFLLALIYCGNALLLYVQNTALATLGQRVVLTIRERLFSHLVSLPHGFFEKARTGDLTSRISKDTADAQDILESLLTVLIRSLPTVVGILVVSFVMDWIYALTFVMVIPVVYWANVFFSRRTREAVRRQRRIEGALASSVQETFYYHKAVTSLSLENEVVDDFLEGGRESAQQAVRAGRYQGMLTASMDMLVGATSLLVLFVGILRIIHGCLTVGQLMVFLSYLNSLFKPIREMSKFAGRWAKSSAALERIEEIMALNPAEMGACDVPHAVPAPRFRGHVQFRDVWFGYDKDRPLLRGFEMAVAAGERVALVGDSGSGKSTLLHLLMRLYDPDRGAVLVDGRDIREFTLASLRNQMAVVLQDSYIFRMSVRDNIAMAKPGATEDEVVAAARAAGAHEFILGLSQGYDTQLGEGGGGLSGGQKRRLAIARAILRDAPIVVLDEPTVGLDAASEKRVMASIQRLTRGRTTFMVTHQLATIMDFDRIVVLSGGEVVESGRHEDLVQAGGLYQRLWESQRAEEESPLPAGSQEILEA
ncbi:ATP-binding cassette, subfamily B [Desulfacinum hydrothermale DSM 13146]|uniref:ATP-binding cassette, subfamily B n=1 Tax=Desulfacinum hydrothermale DSM 13146 TaxID=1121390 RepID=A0A1W1XEM1_9BACT|nr:ABC transporter ATP-binding protein [Desulfacinum hydrothermale]SMC22330.1 ATP-binding cassette, subfamily B [Desulfacinum hydrothermale DSM 13146]